MCDFAIVRREDRLYLVGYDLVVGIDEDLYLHSACCYARIAGRYAGGAWCTVCRSRGHYETIPLSTPASIVLEDPAAFTVVEEWLSPRFSVLEAALVAREAVELARACRSGAPRG